MEVVVHVLIDNKEKNRDMKKVFVTTLTLFPTNRVYCTCIVFYFSINKSKN